MPDYFKGEESRPVEVVVGEYPDVQIWVMVGYDVKQGDSWGNFPPKDGSVPILVGDPPKKDIDFYYYCEVEWTATDGLVHRGKIQVTQALMPEWWKIEPVRESE